MSLPNFLTFIRIFISPVFLAIYVWHTQLGIGELALPFILIGLLLVSELSDIFDGFFARKYNQVTDLGKIIDPMADSISRISIFLTFTQGVVQLPLLLVFVFLYRDSVIGTLRTVCALRGFALAARPSGKIKAVVQAVVAFCILILMIPHALGHLSTEWLQKAAFWLVVMAAVYTFFSGIDYIWANRKYVKALLTKKKKA